MSRIISLLTLPLFLYGVGVWAAQASETPLEQTPITAPVVEEQPQKIRTIQKHKLYQKKLGYQRDVVTPKPETPPEKPPVPVAKEPLANQAKKRTPVPGKVKHKPDLTQPKPAKVEPKKVTPPKATTPRIEALPPKEPSSKAKIVVKTPPPRIESLPSNEVKKGTATVKKNAKPRAL